MDLDIDWQLQLGRSPQGFAQDFFLDFELMFVAGVLVVATAAWAEVGTAGLDALRGRRDDLIGTGACKAGLLLGKRGVNFFPRKHKWHEYGLASAARVGGQARQPFAAVDQLFNGEQQGVILNDAITKLFLQPRRRPTPTES